METQAHELCPAFPIYHPERSEGPTVAALAMNAWILRTAQEDGGKGFGPVRVHSRPFLVPLFGFSTDV